jgi:glycosyltransferase involved in cell wall biosynthesis
MVKTNGTVFVLGEELSRDTEVQLRYLCSALQSRGELGRFSEVRLRDGERLQENLRASASAVFVGQVPINLINLARASDAAAIYWGTEVEKSDWQSFAQLRQIIAAADVLVVATSEETIAPAELAGTPVVAVGRGVPAAGKETPVREALAVVDADAHDSLAYAELLRLIDQCDVLIAGQSWMAVLESLARGKCVAVRRSHPFAGKILDGVNGIVLSDEAPKNLEREIANKVRGRLPQVSLAAKRTWEAEFRIDQVCDRLLVLLGKADRREFQRKRADKSYEAWVARYDSIGSGERATIRRQLRALRQQPLISIVLPVFNPALKFLHAAVESVRQQLYQDWELCIADDASTDGRVRPFLEQMAAKESRIKLTFRERNGHIAACSNSALELAAGEWVALLDQDDVIAPHALALIAATVNKHPDAGLIYSDEDKLDDQELRCRPFFKPDWNPELLLGQNCVSHLGVYRRSLLREIGGFREGFEGSQDYDLVLRCAEKLRPTQIRHIPRVLYHWRMIEGSVAAVAEAKPYAPVAARRAIADHLQRRGIAGRVEACPENREWHRVVYDLPQPPPLVSIIIPTRDRLPLFRRCIHSIREETLYSPFEIIIVDNGSAEEETRRFLQSIGQKTNVTVVQDEGEFNFSRLINRGAELARGELLAFLNNDIEAKERNWLREMVSNAVRAEVGAVGARLWYPDGRLQHGGVILGLNGVASHAFHRFPPQPIAPMHRTFVLAQNTSAVTAACMVTRKDIFSDLGGFDENLPRNFNDVDFCMRLRERGWLIVWTPYANLIHHESATRGHEAHAENRERLFREASYMEKKWSAQILRDPYYSPNLSLHSGGFDLAFPPRWENEAAITEAD